MPYIDEACLCMPNIMTNFNYDLLKVSKMTNFNYDLFKFSKMFVSQKGYIE